MTLLIVIGIIVVVAVAVLIGMSLPGRVASEHRVTPHSDLDAESEAFRDHPPGGGTGSI
jgi:hypothetical protein